MTTLEWIVLLCLILTSGGVWYGRTRWGYYGWLLPALLLLLLILLLTNAIQVSL